MVGYQDLVHGRCLDILPMQVQALKMSKQYLLIRMVDNLIKKLNIDKYIGKSLFTHNRPSQFFFTFFPVTGR